MLPSLQPLHSGLSFLISCIQELTVPHARVNASFHFARPALGQTSLLFFILPLHLLLPAHYKDLGERLTAFEGKALLIPQITYIKVFLFPLYYLKSGLSIRCCCSDGKDNPCFEVMQVQASGFAENLHTQNTTFFSHQNNNDRADGKTHNIITLNDNAMKKKNDNNYFENDRNEKQNSLASGIRIS